MFVGILAHLPILSDARDGAAAQSPRSRSCRRELFVNVAHHVAGVTGRLENTADGDRCMQAAGSLLTCATRFQVGAD